jgi:hypothetical protein
MQFLMIPFQLLLVTLTIVGLLVKALVFVVSTLDRYARRNAEEARRYRNENGR